MELKSSAGQLVLMYAVGLKSSAGQLVLLKAVELESSAGRPVLMYAVELKSSAGQLLLLYAVDLKSVWTAGVAECCALWSWSSHLDSSCCCMLWSSLHIRGTKEIVSILSCMVHGKSHWFKPNTCCQFSQF